MKKKLKYIRIKKEVIKSLTKDTFDISKFKKLSKAEIEASRRKVYDYLF